MKKTAKKSKQSQTLKAKASSKAKRPQPKVVKSAKAPLSKANKPKGAASKEFVKTAAVSKQKKPLKKAVASKNKSVMALKGKTQPQKGAPKKPVKTPVKKTPAKKASAKVPARKLPAKASAKKPSAKTAQSKPGLKKNFVKISKKTEKKSGTKVLSKTAKKVQAKTLKTAKKEPKSAKPKAQSKPASKASPKPASKAESASKPLKSRPSKTENPKPQAKSSDISTARGKETLQSGAANSPAEIKSSKKFRAQRSRPSQNISFTLEDLDLYLSRRQSGAMAANKEVSVLGTSGKSGKVSAVQPKASVPAPKKKAEVASIFDILGFNPVEAPTREKVESKDIPRKWKKYYSKLMELRKHHSQGIESRVEEVHKRSAKEDSGDLSSYGQHLADAGSESFERDMAYNLLSAGKEVLLEIDEAIKRMKNGTYGICEVTGKPIPEDRLWSIPFTRYSKEGQEAKELEQRRAKSSQRSIYEMPSEGTSSGDEVEENS